MKTLGMAKENNFVLREAAKAAQMGYYDHLAAGGKGDPAEERWIEALTAGADAITQVVVLESRLAQVEKERDAAVADLDTALNNVAVMNLDCNFCKYKDRPVCESCEWEWRGVCPENTKEGPKCTTGN